MGLLRNLLKGKDKAEFKAKLKEAQEDERVMSLVQERKKSANQRELERYMREKEEAHIKDALHKIHKKQDQENWKSSKMVLSKGASMLKDDRPILKEKNIFKGKSNNIPFTKGGENMFFK